MPVIRAVDPAVLIMQLNIEGLSAAKCSVIQLLAKKHHIDVNNFYAYEKESAVYLPH